MQTKDEQSADNRDVLASGKETFKIEVPYKLIETGEKDKPKPMLVYLHGFNDNIRRFEMSVEELLSLEAYHLFIQGPYPIYDRSRKKNVSDWGRAWYLYDGNRGQFIKSLEISSEFLQEIIEKILGLTSANRLGMIGYSMGGYLAGYFSLTRWKHVNDLVVAGARIKTEVLDNNWDQVKHLNILALHGNKDEDVELGPQKKEIQKLQKHGVSATFEEVDAAHKLEKAFIDKIKAWFLDKGYQSSE